MKFSAKLVENVGNFIFIVPFIMIIGFRLFMLRFTKPINIIEDAEMLWLYFVGGVPATTLFGYIFLKCRKSIDHQSRREVQDLKYTQAKTRFTDNFKTDYEVAINSLLDFRLEIKSFS